MKKSRRTSDTQYILDEQIGFWLRVALQRHRAIFSSKMPHDLTPIQFAVMAKILEVGSCSQSRLSRTIYVDPATIKGVVDRLCKRGLLAIESDPNDLRRREVKLTERGRQVVKLATKFGTDITTKTMVPLNKNEQLVIISLLAKLSGVRRSRAATKPKSKIDMTTRRGYSFADNV
jgi:DNA-binding MarR family transcriptional regulator